MTDDEKLGAPWTILKILRWTTGFFEQRDIDAPRVDAEVLLAEVLGVERIELYAHFDRPLADDELAAYRQMVKRRAAREPTAYIVGHREFWGMRLQVDPRVLIPRPDTETLVRTALDHIQQGSEMRVADIGTGSAAVAVALATQRPELHIAATDNDADALQVAAANVEAHGVDETVSLVEGDLLDPIGEQFKPLDFIVSNPPYVAEPERDELQPEVRDWEPTEALFAGEDGLDVIRRLIPAAFDALAPCGLLMFEIGYRQGEAVRELLEDAGYTDIAIVQDYGDRDRVAVGRRPDRDSS